MSRGAAVATDAAEYELAAERDERDVHAERHEQAERGVVEFLQSRLPARREHHDFELHGGDDHECVWLADANERSEHVENIPAGVWQGTGFTFNNPAGFVVPSLITNGLLPNATYSFLQNAFVPLNTNYFETLPDFPVPQWSLVVSNRLVCLMADGDRIVDLVLLKDGGNIDVTRELLSGAISTYPGGTPSSLVGVWSTNRYATNTPPMGILQQIDISAGDLLYPLTAVDWRAFSVTPVANETAKDVAIRTFRAFMGLPPRPGDPVIPNPSYLAMTVPFNPAAKMVVVSEWQANDPLIHTHMEDLRRDPPTNHYFKPSQFATNIYPATLGGMNTRYAPWGGRPLSGFPGPLDYDLAVKDPDVYGSDNWNFPINQTLAPHWLGRVHRGTPWQTIYLKPEVAPIADWFQINTNITTHPTNDWRMVELLASLFNTNDVCTLTSVNSINVDAWIATLNGLTVLSNNDAHPQLYDVPTFDSIVIAPGAPQISSVVDGINRASQVQRAHYFENLSSFFTVPELSVASPWLNLSTPDQLQWGLTDEAYEALPSQLLSRVRVDPIGTATRVGNSIELRFTAFDGYAFRVEGSTNLSTWTTVSGPHYSTNGVFTLTLPTSSGPQFFRAVLPPGN
jgi:hypothetical protein